MGTVPRFWADLQKLFHWFCVSCNWKTGHFHVFHGFGQTLHGFGQILIPTPPKFINSQHEIVRFHSIFNCPKPCCIERLRQHLSLSLYTTRFWAVGLPADGRPAGRRTTYRWPPRATEWHTCVTYIRRQRNWIDVVVHIYTPTTPQRIRWYTTHREQISSRVAVTTFQN